MDSKTNIKVEKYYPINQEETITNKHEQGANDDLEVMRELGTSQYFLYQNGANTYKNVIQIGHNGAKASQKCSQSEQRGAKGESKATESV